MAEKNLELVGHGRRNALVSINEQFNVSDSVTHLQHMMREVTKKEFTAANVQAACACAGQINSTIKTAIMAAKFLAEK